MDLHSGPMSALAPSNQPCRSSTIYHCMVHDHGVSFPRAAQLRHHKQQRMGTHLVREENLIDHDVVSINAELRELLHQSRR
eukprot:scaffold7052_cov254-Pinguiococcus_pyrenoidosus.AAC.12